MPKKPTFGPLNPEPKSRLLRRAREELAARGEDGPQPIRMEDLPLAKFGPPVLTNHDRLTAQFALHHEHLGEHPTSIVLNYAEMLETMEQPYQRRMVIPPTWTKIDLGWYADKLDKVGTVAIENKASCCGGDSTVQPTPEQLEEVKRQIVLVSFADAPADAKPCLKIRPQRHLVCEPTDVQQLWVKGAEGDVSIMLHILPR